MIPVSTEQACVNIGIIASADLYIYIYICFIYIYMLYMWLPAGQTVHSARSLDTLWYACQE